MARTVRDDDPAATRELVTANGADDERLRAELDFRAARIDFLDYQRGAGGPRRQPMRGVDPDYTDILDYIVRCTHKMWEEGGVGLLYDHYAHNAVVWSDWGYSYGRDQTIARVIQQMAAWPNLRLYADDVIWAGNEDSGFRTCHRLTETGHNSGHSGYGPPTGRTMKVSIFANCVMRENKIYEEWLVVDELTIVRQLGLDPHAVLRAMAERMTSPLRDVAGEPVNARGQGTPAPFVPRAAGAFDIDDFLRGGLHEVWNWRLLNRIPDLYATNVVIHGPSGRELAGLGDARQWVVTLLAAFPDGHFEIDDLYWNGSERGDQRVAVRWSFTGTHRGVGPWGTPSGRPVRIIGTTIYRLRDEKIAEEWTIFNELALLWKLHYT